MYSVNSLGTDRTENTTAKKGQDAAFGACSTYTSHLSQHHSLEVTSPNDGPPKHGVLASKQAQHRLFSDVMELFAENVVSKYWRIAVEALDQNKPPAKFPEYVPQTGHDVGRYALREAEFWTCGFFPGILYSLLERAMMFPQFCPIMEKSTSSNKPDTIGFHEQLLDLCRTWSGPLHNMAARTDTHDLGFMIQPALRADWELTGNRSCLQSVLTAARSLATRYSSRVGAIRSWDALIQKKINIQSTADDFLVIIDSMCNLDLLFYASAHLSDPSLAAIATRHAYTLLSTHLRCERVSRPGFESPVYSTCHVANLDPKTGQLKQRMTAQGYTSTSTWARGQAWAILGYAQTYMWTKDRNFLSAACGLAEYFMHRLETAPDCVEVPAGDGKGMMGRYVPMWDFDAPVDSAFPLRDSSAGIIAANGMLVLAQAFAGLHDHALADRYQTSSILIVKDTLDFSLSQDKAQLILGSDGSIMVEDVQKGRRFDALLRNATAHNNAHEYRRYCDHGLVYGDYYLIEFGNRLLRMGLI